MRWVVVPAIALGMLLVVPLGLWLLHAPGVGVLRRVWPWAGVIGVVALLLPTGVGAAAVAVPYAAVTVALAGAAAARFARVAGALRPTAARAGALLGVPLGASAAAGVPLGTPAAAGVPLGVPGAWGLAAVTREVAVLTALVAPSIAGLSLVAERGGWALLGFGPKILLLTVAHFHYAGFAAALVASLVCGLPNSGRAAAFGALTVPAGTALVLAGFFLGDVVELAGAVVLTAGMWVVGGLTWRARAAAPDRVTRVLLATSSVVLIVTMLLALDWALGEAFGVPKLSLTWMAATHGVLNAVGFGLCGVLAWRGLSVGELAGRTRREAS
ncbi:YndJ family transporter [Cryptosporangium aurantiacum]|uniref:YndJ-like protein n=1 Tax=Cryptosporangium aurantiacum TaxID=134849 RepID=A0A1M7Q855_9ACTN|nr:YndJ family transporter [Cryptosporangium aurantiacum]SHN26420.1 YndJ-like protein [Cryptosporangium aurantiacum]